MMMIYFLSNNKIFYLVFVYESNLEFHNKFYSIKEKKFLLHSSLLRQTIFFLPYCDWRILHPIAIQETTIFDMFHERFFTKEIYNPLSVPGGCYWIAASLYSCILFIHSLESSNRMSKEFLVWDLPIRDLKR